MGLLPFMALGGAAAGALGAMLGIGGGFIIVPMLAILFHVPMHTAIAAGQVCVIGTSSVATAHYLRERLVHIRVGLVLEISTTAGALAGAVLGTSLNPQVLSVVFGLVLILVAWRMLVSRDSVDDGSVTVESCQVQRWWIGHAGAFVGGTLSGLLGIGGGVVKVPVICLGMGVPMRIAAATSSFMIGITGVTAAVVYYGRGYTDLFVTGATLVGVLLGSMVGARMASRVSSRYLRVGFTLVAGYTAVVMVLRGLGVAI